MAIICFANADKRRKKYQMQENFHLLHLYAQRITAAPVSVTYNDKGGREKR
jgi:hypothetical protein